MNTLKCDNEIIKVMLEERDTLGDMAMVSGYTMDKLRGMIEKIINQSIYEEAGRDGYEQDLKDRAEAELMRTETQERRST